MTPETRDNVGCEDCGAPYGKDGWCDVVIPDAIWNSLNACLLCFRCMTKRLLAAGYDYPNLVPVIVASGPYKDANEEWRMIGWEHGHKVGAQETEDALTAAGLPALVAECERLRAENETYRDACALAARAIDHEKGRAEQAEARAVKLMAILKQSRAVLIRHTHDGDAATVANRIDDIEQGGGND